MARAVTLDQFKLAMWLPSDDSRGSDNPGVDLVNRKWRWWRSPPWSLPTIFFQQENQFCVKLGQCDTHQVFTDASNNELNNSSWPPLYQSNQSNQSIADKNLNAGMESAPVDVSPAPSTRGFKGVLSKARRGGKDNSSTPSINGTETSSEANGIRSSIESSQENSRAGRQSLEDGASISKPRKLSKMILGRLRRKKPSQDGVGDQQGEEEEEEEADEVDDDRRGRSISEVATTSITLQPTTNSRSQSLQDGDGGSSPIPHATDDEL